MNYPRYEIFSDLKGEFRFNLVDTNYKVILTASEGYVNKADCKNAIAVCQANSPYDKNYDKRTTVSSKYYFTLRSSNGRDIGRSEDYTTSSGRDTGISNVKKEGPSKNVFDRTL